MNESRLHIREAAADFRYLLARGYPRKEALALVGNRYNLSRTGRQILHRGVFPPPVAAARRARLRLLRDLAGQPLALDGHNVLITLECALRGVPLVAADDGFIRDVGLVSRAFKPSARTDRVLELLAGFLAAHQAGSLRVCYDAPLSLSGELARRTVEVFRSRGLQAEALALAVPEQELAAFPGPVATSDTALIDAHAPVVDLAGEIIRQQNLGELTALD
jgi:hypothetical protein